MYREGKKIKTAIRLPDYTTAAWQGHGLEVASRPRSSARRPDPCSTFPLKNQFISSGSTILIRLGSTGPRRIAIAAILMMNFARSVLG
jgi:hypothetical protein